MLGYIYRLIHGFEQEHGIQPNLLYLNHLHSEHLKAAFDENYSLGQIMTMLQMEMVIDTEVMHPRVAWAQSAQRMAS